MIYSADALPGFAHQVQPDQYSGRSFRSNPCIGSGKELKIRQVGVILTGVQTRNAPSYATIVRTVPVYLVAQNAIALNDLIVWLALSAEEASMVFFARSFGLYG